MLFSTLLTKNKIRFFLVKSLGFAIVFILVNLFFFSYLCGYHQIGSILYDYLFFGLLDGEHIRSLLVRYVILLICALGVSSVWKLEVYNIGTESQYVSGCILASFSASKISFVPFYIKSSIMILSGILGGMAYAFIPAILARLRNVDVVMSTILLNLVNFHLVQYLALNFNDFILFKSDPKPSEKTMMILFVLLISSLLVFFVKHQWQKMTSNLLKTSEDSRLYICFIALLFSGGLCGFAGSIGHLFYLETNVLNISKSFGFIAIPIAILSHSDPYKILYMTVFFSYMYVQLEHIAGKYMLSSNSLLVLHGITILTLYLYHKTFDDIGEKFAISK